MVDKLGDSRQTLENTDPRTVSRVIRGMTTPILEMMHAGQITVKEAGQMYQRVFESDVVAEEVRQSQEHRGVMPLTSQTARLWSFRLKAASTEDPK